MREAISPAVLLSLVAFTCSPDSFGSENTVSTPNVVLIMSDDQGYADVGFRGHTTLKTPHLDAMADVSLRFDRFYAAAPVCSPTRGSCLTGRHPYRYGIFSANTGHLPAQETTLGEILQEQGYRTGHFGKWHLGTLTKDEKESNRGGPRGAAHYAPPWEHGFDVCFSTEAKVPTHDPMITPPSWAGGVGKKEVGAPYGTSYWTGPADKVLDDLDGDDSALIMDRALDFLRQTTKDGRSFLAVIWFHAPHLPVVGGEEDLSLYPDGPERHRHYFGCLSALDRQVGRLRSTLRELGVAENTMVFYASDNGPEGQAGKAPGSASPLQGRKRSLLEGGIRVPALLEWPAVIREARVTDEPCTTSDYVPTILSALGIAHPHPSPKFDGCDLMPLIRGEDWARPTPIAFESAKQLALIDRRFKLYTKNAGRGKEALGPWRLFDLRDDPAESKDIGKEHPEILGEMRDHLIAWRQSCEQSREALRDGEEVR